MSFSAMISENLDGVFVIFSVVYTHTHPMSVYPSLGLTVHDAVIYRVRISFYEYFKCSFAFRESVIVRKAMVRKTPLYVR